MICLALPAWSIEGYASVSFGKSRPSRSAEPNRQNRRAARRKHNLNRPGPVWVILRRPPALPTEVKAPRSAMKCAQRCQSTHMTRSSIQTNYLVMSKVVSWSKSPSTIGETSCRRRCFKVSVRQSTTRSWRRWRTGIFAPPRAMASQFLPSRMSTITSNLRAEWA